MKNFLLILLLLVAGLHLEAQNCIADFNHSKQSLGVQFIDTSFSSNPVNSYSWSFGDGNFSFVQNPYHIYNQPGNYSVCLTITSNNCIDSVCKTINVTASPNSCQAAFIYFTNGLNVQFIDSSTTSNRSLFIWDFGDNTFSNQKNPSHTYANAGTYVVNFSIYDSLNSCFSQTQDTLVVASSQPPCSANFNYTTNQGSVSFQNTGLNYTGATWDFGDGATSSQINPTHIYSQSGSYTVCLTVTDSLNNCSSTFCDSIVVSIPPPCSANFNYTTNQGSVFFQNTGLNYTGATWDFGDGTTSNQTNPTHIYSQSGSYVVCLTVTDSLNNCSSTFCDSIVVSIPPPCSANFNYTTNQGSVFFQNTGLNYTGASWDFGDGATSSQINPTHIYSQSGSYAVCLTVTDSLNNCSSTFCDSIVVSIPPPCSANFNYTTNQGSVSFQNTGLNYTGATWDFGDGTTSNQTNPTYIYSQSGSYAVCLTVTDSLNNCSSIFCDSIVVSIPPPCSANFNYTTNQGNVSFQNTSLNYTGATWDFGDGTTSNQTNPTHIYSQSGFYAVCLTVTDSLNNCSSTFCDSIVASISPPCLAGFQSETINDTTYFQNTAISFNRVIYYFGDGDSSLLPNPTHLYQRSDRYVVTQKVFNDTINCVDTYIDTILVSVSQSCFAKYEIAIDTNQLGTLFLVNTSSNDPSHAYNWNFGDGSFASGRLVSHQFALNKAYKICLTITDSVLNCISTYCDSVGLDSNGGVLKSAGFKLNVIEGTFIGIGENMFSDNNLKIYPVPFSDNLTIEFDKMEKKTLYQIIDAQGRLRRERVMNQKKERLDIQELPAGIYYLRLFTNKNAITKKLIKL